MTQANSPDGGSADAASEDDRLRVQEVQHVGDADAQPVARVLNQFHGHRIAIQCCVDELVDTRRWTAIQSRSAQLVFRPFEKRWSANESRQAAPEAAHALRPVWVDGRMADLASDASTAAEDPAVDDEAGADARRDLDVCEIVAG